jgi:hypothetical protein
MLLPKALTVRRAKLEDAPVYPKRFWNSGGNEPMARVRLVEINSISGAYTTIYATQVTRRVEILEDFSGNAGIAQGLEYLLPDPSSNNPANPLWDGPFEIAPQTEPIILGEPIPQGDGFGLVLGHGPDSSGGFELPPTPLIQIRSASETSTIVRVSEFA